MNRKFTIILTLLAAMAAGRGMAAVATNAAVTNAAPAPAAPATNAPPVDTTAPAPTPIASTASNGKIDFDSFKLIRERNIFDMSRTGRIGPHPPPRQVIVDDFSLVGIMSYEKGQYAFFDGSSPVYRQNLKAGQAITGTGYILKEIGPDYVDLLTTNKQTVRMQMGWTVRREDKGPWSAPTLRSDSLLADSGSSSSRSSRSDRSDRGDRGSSNSSSDRSDRRLYRRNRDGSSGGTADAGAGASDQKTDASSSNSSSDSDVIKRLMEKRAKEKGDQ